MSNLPPGVSENMIPGNRPEDEEDEQFTAVLLDKMDEHKLGQAPIDDARVWAVILLARDIGYTDGFNEGYAEAQIDEAAKHLE